MSGAGEGALFIICALPLAGVDLVPNGEPGNVTILEGGKFI